MLQYRIRHIQYILESFVKTARTRTPMIRIYSRCILDPFRILKNLLDISTLNTDLVQFNTCRRMLSLTFHILYEVSIRAEIMEPKTHTHLTTKMSA